MRTGMIYSAAATVCRTIAQFSRHWDTHGIYIGHAKEDLIELEWCVKQASIRLRIVEITYTTHLYDIKYK